MIEPSDIRPVLLSEVVVTAAPQTVLITGLGSCVAACLYDPIARVGGMNHFLLPSGTAKKGAGLQFGEQAMPALVKAVLQAGGQQRNLVCKVFGGGAVVPLLDQIGEVNSRYVMQYLADAGIACVANSLGGQYARRIRFWPATGRVQHSFITDHVAMKDILETEKSISAVSGAVKF
ncbi:chemotaxis protein CheD [Acetobacter orientalis]|uniref:chemotaxis protein CheD n=1 Tax=Acetobacter orientalis TaxID=146474 RepID=UPI0039E8992F